MHLILALRHIGLQLQQGIENGPSGWASLGVGGALAGLMFWFYRQDRLDERRRAEERERLAKAETEERQKTRKEEKDRLLSVVERNARASEGLTKMFSNLQSWLKENARKNEKALDQAVSRSLRGARAKRS